MFEGLPWELGQDHLGDLAGRSLSGLTPLQAADALLGADLLALLDVDQGVAEAVVAQLQVALNQVAALQAVFIEAVARRVERDVELAKDADRLQGSFPAGWGTGDDYTPSVLAPLLHLSPRTMSGRLAEARTLVNDLPRTLRVALDGELEPWRVAAVVAGATGVSSERLPDFEVALFGEHGVGDATAGVLRKRAERAAARVDPDALVGKVAAGRRERCVRVQPGLWPGTTEWHAVAAADRSRRAWEAVCELADEYVKGKPELSEGQARADAFLDLLLRNVQVQTVVTVGVTDATIDAVLRGPLGTALTRAASAAFGPTPFPTPFPTLLPTSFPTPFPTPLPKPALPYLPPELHPPFTRSATCTRLFAEHLPARTPAGTPSATDAPAPASGKAPATVPAAAPAPASGLVDAGPCGWLLGDEVAALLRHPDTVIRLAKLDPGTGATAYLSSEGYRPGAALARLVRERDGTCRFPGCRTPAARCDLDHAVPFPHGPTDARNLHCLCRRHHGFKHHAGWSVDLAWDGTLTWTSPTGRSYVTFPRDRRDDAA